MVLEMRPACEKCTAEFKPADQAFICVYECTFCADCAREMDLVCPNCGGELVKRPHPKAVAVEVEGK